MTCIIIEDEKIAAQRLQELICKCLENIEILTVIQTVKKAVQWFNENPAPDLVFMDIQLADGLSFEIFEETIVEAPIIFTTAYDEYALKAFKVNSIDYLLKPIEYQDLCNALNAFKNSPFKKPESLYSPEVFDKVLRTITDEYKSKFVIKVGEHLKLIQVSDVACFYSMEKAIFLRNNQGRDYAINHSLDELENLLDPKKFYRISRKYFVALKSIQDIKIYSTSRLKIELDNQDLDDVIVSRDRVQNFKKWLET